MPQDTVRAIAQTQDGFVWLGTNAGLVRFDGYEFVTFTKNDGSLPDNTVTALRTGASGALWIGTSSGVARYAQGKFQIFTAKDGLPRGTIYSMVEDHAGVLWVVLGGRLCRFENGQFRTYPKSDLAPLESVGAVYEDSQRQLWVGGLNGILKREGDKFSVVFQPPESDGNIISAILKDAKGIWAAGTRGLILIQPDGKVRRFTTRDGLANNLIRALYEDRAGNLWVGTYGGLSRRDGDRFVDLKMDDRDWVWCLFEDRENDLWVGMNNALVRLRDDKFSSFGRPEGFPGDEPIVVRQDQQSQLWVGYHDSGLLVMGPHKRRIYTTRDGLPSNEIFGVRVSRPGELLIGTRAGLSRLRGGRFMNYSMPHPTGSSAVLDAIEDIQGNLWAATASGVYELKGTTWTAVIGGNASSADYTVALIQTRGGQLWAGTLASGLWQLTDGATLKPRLFTTANGLGSNQIRSLYEDPEGTLWIGTFGGGVSTLRDGTFRHYDTREGLLSDNVSHIEDDGTSLWLSTDRGISRIPKRQFADFSSGTLKILEPANYGISDGLRSTQCAPAFPAGGGGTLTSQGTLWFPTSNGLATIDPHALSPASPGDRTKPITHIVEVAVNGHAVDLSHAARIKPGAGRIQVRYSGIYLRAPERVRYSYKLEGLDHDWISAGSHRTIDYNPLPHGSYRFIVQAALADGASSQSQFGFEVLPRFYETWAFFFFCCVSMAGLAYGYHRLRLAQIHSRFALVVEERTRLAREIHDTLAQSFVGISLQLDSVQEAFDAGSDAARQYLNHAQKMVRHSLTEARQSMATLRTNELSEQDFPATLMAAVPRWVAGRQVDLRLNVSQLHCKLPTELAQNLLRIAQEAVTNAVKHATAQVIRLDLDVENDILCLHVEDDGKGFEPSDTFSVSGGHFGIVGMRERAKQIGGEFDLASRPGGGTRVEVRIPLAISNSRNRTTAPNNNGKARWKSPFRAG